MRTRTVETVSVVNQIKCDRCGLEVQRDEIRFGEMICIAFDAGYGSIFGDGNRVELDLCESCLRDSLGPWLRVTKPSDPPLASMLAAFSPEKHGGEFPLTANTLGDPESKD